MSGRMRSAYLRQIAAGAFEPTDKRIRAILGGRVVVDSTRAMVVWEPRRVLPSYAVPEADILESLVADPSPPPRGAPPVLHSGVPFRVHTFPGERLRLRAPGGREAEAFRLAEPRLEGLVALDFGGFDTWMEEDEVIVAHPRNPFHRFDILTASRHVGVAWEGEVIAESSRPILVFETQLPMRAYLPREDVRMDRLVPSAHRTLCAYKGEASYWSVDGAGDGGRDLAWSYEEPRHEGARIAGLVAFFNERVDLTIDGVAWERPVTQWSPRWDGRSI